MLLLLLKLSFLYNLIKDNISYTAIIPKKIPKIFFKLSVFKIKAICAPIIAPITPNIMIGSAIFHFIIPLLKFKKIEIKATGTKKTILVACAICCSIPPKK